MGVEAAGFVDRGVDLFESLADGFNFGEPAFAFQHGTDELVAADYGRVGNNLPVCACGVVVALDFAGYAPAPDCFAQLPLVAVDDFELHTESSAENKIALLRERAIVEVFCVDVLDEFFADYEQEAVRILKNRLVANELSRAVAMAKAAAGTLESKTWKSGGGTNPDLDIRKLITSVGDKGGINANRVLVGDAAWTYRLESLLGSQNVASGGQAMFTIDNLRGFVGAEKILTCDKRFETKVKDSDGKAAKEYKAFLANYVLAFNARDGISKFDASTFKRFVGEEGFKVYVEKKTKRTIVTVEHYSLLAQTGVGACKGLSVSNS